MMNERNKLKVTPYTQSIAVIMFGLNPTQRSGSRVAEREGVESKV